MPSPLRTCDHCGRRVTNRGPKSKTGIYFCSETECRAAKARAERRREGLHENTGPDAPTACSNCGDDLEPRKMRIDDNPLGRWCPKSACRRAAEAAHIELRKAVVMMADYGPRIEFLHRALVLPRVTCPKCGIEDAVNGYPHRDDFATRCDGTGDGVLKVLDAQAVWPNRFGAPPAILALLDD